MFDLQYIALGLVQGATEFLPISSSAHLILVNEFFNWSDQGLFNDVAVHAGTLGAVILYLKNDLKRIAFDFFLFEITDTRKNHGIKIIVATIPAIVIGFFVYQYFIYDLRNLTVIAYANIFFGIALFIVDRFSLSEHRWQILNYRQVFLIGLCQSLAFIPGASRAGVTITGARLLGIKRDSSAIFSMLLSIPIILASISLILLDIYSLKLTEVNIIQTLTSTIVAFITAFASIHFMMKILQKTNFSIFIVYRVFLGLFILMVFN